MNTNSPQSKTKTGLFELFVVFLRLGCTSFGGPVAHIAYFKEAFVNRRAWLTEERFGELLGLCQFVPGPSSSQLGFAIARDHSGIRGGLLAWLGFTLPSAIIMIGFAYGLFQLEASLQSTIQGLLVAAVAIVAHATFSLGRKLCPDPTRITIAVATTAAVLQWPGTQTQVVMILLSCIWGQLIYKSSIGPEGESPSKRGVRKPFAVLAVLTCATLLVVSLLTPKGSPAALWATHYEAGALVFGGGHVVLPLLHDGAVAHGILTEEQFLAGYSAAQTLPGPLFALSAFIGTASNQTTPAILGGFIALCAIFLPGILLLLGLLPFWETIRNQPWAQAGLLGANAAVVGLLLAALINPVWAHGIRNLADFAVAAIAFSALLRFKVPAWIVVFICALNGYLFS